MKPALLLCISLLPVTAFAAPVHVTLNVDASVTANADGFFTLSQVASLSGGTKDGQARLASVVVGRVPLPGETRNLTDGDLFLKLRQAGLHPGTDAIVDGASRVTVTALSADAPVTPLAVRASSPGVNAPLAAEMPAQPIVHIGDPVAIVVQDGPILITASGEAREAGHAGQSIRVHRSGVMTDLHATVLDSKTVRLEM